MENKVMIKELAMGLRENQKFDIVRGLQETELHKELKELLSAMDPVSYVEITHGSDEFGKDLVMVRHDPLGDRITGIIVKTGDISSRQSGTIDDIKSQVEQAFSNPALLKGFEFQGDLDITFVTVIIAGILSKQAMIRLKAEINKPIKRPNLIIHDLKWLIDNFTQYYLYCTPVSQAMTKRVSWRF